MTADHHPRGREAATPDGQHHGLAGTPDSRTAYTADELLIEARASLPRRPSPAEALAAQARGALLIDIRGDDQRRACGLIPGALLLPRNALEWRCDPTGQWRHSAMTGPDQHLILICQEGFQSSLAAATLQRFGLVNATDIDGGFVAWATAGLPVTAPPTTGQDHPVTVTPTAEAPALCQPRPVQQTRVARLFLGPGGIPRSRVLRGSPLGSRPAGWRAWPLGRLADPRSLWSQVLEDRHVGAADVVGSYLLRAAARTA